MSELTKEQIDRLKEIYEELKAIEGSLPVTITHRSSINLIDEQIVLSYHDLIKNIEGVIQKNLSN